MKQELHFNKAPEQCPYCSGEENIEQIETNIEEEELERVFFCNVCKKQFKILQSLGKPRLFVE